MRDFRELAREYEARRFPVSHRLDLHGEGPAAARERALRWIQSRAHEQPGEEFLLIVERGRRPGGSSGPVRREVERLLAELQGRLVAWWQDFGTGGLALRISDHPTMLEGGAPPAVQGEGRTPETAGAALVSVRDDIPPELQETAWRAAEVRRDREGLSLGLMDVVLRRIWIEAQAAAMEGGTSFESALEGILEEELRLREAQEEW